MKKKVLLVLLSMLIALLPLAFVACGGAKREVIEDPALEVYSQREHIGWDASLGNVGKEKYSEYFENGSPAFIIPGLNEGENFVAQGIEYCEALDWTLLSGYVKPATDNPNSVIFVIDMSKDALVNGVRFEGALIKEILLDKADGAPFTGHAGGIAVSKNNVWISDGGRLYYIPLSKLVSAPASSHIRLVDSIKTPVGGSYTSYADGVLYVGEFEYASEDYVTAPAHHSGDLTAWTVGYRLKEDGSAGYDAATGIKSDSLKEAAVPDIILWHGSKVQGMTVAGDKVALSVSYGRMISSSILLYDYPEGDADGSADIEGVAVPYYLLSDPVTVAAPPMTEDLGVIREGDSYSVFVVTESGSFEYYGADLASYAFNPLDFVWKYEVD